MQFHCICLYLVYFCILSGSHPFGSWAHSTSHITAGFHHLVTSRYFPPALGLIQEDIAPERRFKVCKQGWLLDGVWQHQLSFNLRTSFYFCVMPGVFTVKLTQVFIYLYLKIYFILLFASHLTGENCLSWKFSLHL